MQRTRAFGFFVRLLLGGAMAAGVLLVTAGDTAADQTTPPGKTVLGVACADIYALGIDRQANLRAAAIRVGCGLEKAGAPGPGSTEGEPATPTPGNVETITGREIYPHVTQSESSVWSSDGHTIVVNYNDSRTAPSNFSGVSVSSDGGATFARLNPSPLATGHGTNFGDPILVYNQKLAKWFAGDLATGCGGQGLGLWSSLDAYTWTVGACAHTGGNDDRESMWVDNTPTSPHYGRMYISFNNFNVGSGALQSTFSDDGVTWSAPVNVPGNTNFIRDVQLTGGPDGSVFIATMNEGGGGFANRQNFMYRSTDGGVTWTVNSGTMGAAFAPPGDLLCSSNSYFVNVAPIWRHMGWGQPGVGPGGVVHYAYAGKGGNSGDTGDIFYVRSTDNGSTWSAPIVLNTDQASGGNKTQWMPSLSVTAAGDVHAYWYDRRNTTDGVNYQVWGRISHDNGATWQPDQPVSSLLLVIPQPEQPDPNIQACYAGDYNYATAYGNTHYATWNDGRVKVSDGSLLHSQQDVFFAAFPGKPPEFLIDFDGDAHGDILFRSTNGSLMEWQMLGSTPGAQIKAQETFATVTTDWTIQDTGDFDGDGKSDILWRRTDGTYALWLMDGFNVKSANVLGVIGNEWQTAGVGDFDGDGKSDILFRRNTDGPV